MSNHHPPRVLNVALAWSGMVLASPLPAIVWGEFSSEEARDPRWLPATIWAQISGLTVLLLIALLRPAARPMRLPLIMLLAFLAGWRVLTPLATKSDAWEQWQTNQSVGLSLATSRVQWLPPAALMTLVAVGGGLRRKDLYLTLGDWTAPVMPESLFPFRGWRWFPGMFLLIVFLTAATFLVGEFVLAAPGWITSLGPDFQKADRIRVHFPGIVAGSLLNAVSEECIFRVLLLGCFIPAVGVRQALALTAVLFGLEHWPTAGMGIVLTSYCGWIYGKSMTETRGWSWAMVQHTLADLPIYALVVMARR
ncbi:MAG: CPBP family intramembrane metalloprotease [Pirellulales bacterium]|nr:CPBP family intramembrane metalloprotease [Pirellulales bacterium]